MDVLIGSNHSPYFNYVEVSDEKDIQSNFIIRKVEQRSRASTLVYLRITVDGARTELSLQRECDPDPWDSDRGRLTGKTEEVKSFNAYLDAVQLKIYDIFQSFISTGVDFDGEKIKARYLGFDVEKLRMFLEVYKEHSKEFEALVGKGLSYRTLQKYKTIKAYVAELLKYQYALNDIELNQIDYQFVKNLEIYLKSAKHCCHNTAMDYLKKIQENYEPVHCEEMD